MTMTTEIKTLADVSRLYIQGINVCKGCEYELYASCTPGRVPTCNKQLEKYNQKQ